MKERQLSQGKVTTGYVTARDVVEIGERVKDSMNKPNKKTLAGVRRIEIEFQGDSRRAKAYTRTYTALVHGTARILAKYLPPELEGKAREELFMKMIIELANEGLGLSYGNNQFGFLYESVKTGKLDCDVSATLTLDVGKIVGVKMKLVVVQGPPDIETWRHTVIATENYGFETTNGEYFPIGELRNRYPMVFSITSDKRRIEALAYDVVGAALGKRGEHEKSIEPLEKAIKLEPKNASYHYDLGVAHSKMKDYAKAAENFLNAVALEPKYSDAYRALGQCCEEQGRPVEAIKYFEMAVQLNQMDAFAYSALGWIHSKLKDNRKAIEYFTKTVDIFDTNFGFDEQQALNRMMMGKEYAILGENKQAVECFEKSVKLDGKNPFAWLALGSGYVDLGEYGKAVESCNKALTLAAEKKEPYLIFVRVHEVMADAYSRLGEPIEAMENIWRIIELCQKAIQQNSRDAEAYYQLGRANFAIGNYGIAATNFQTAVSINPEHERAKQELVAVGKHL